MGWGGVGVDGERENASEETKFEALMSRYIFINRSSIQAIVPLLHINDFQLLTKNWTYDAKCSAVMALKKFYDCLIA